MSFIPKSGMGNVVVEDEDVRASLQARQEGKGNGRRGVVYAESV